MRVGTRIKFKFRCHEGTARGFDSIYLDLLNGDASDWLKTLWS